MNATHFRIPIPRSLSTLACVSLLALSSGTVSAQSGITLSPQQDLNTPDAVVQFWTPERMKAARPMKLPRVEGRPAPAAPETVKPSGKAGQVKAVAPKGVKLDRKAPALQLSATPEVGPGSTVWYDYPPPQNTFDLLGGSVRMQFPMSTFGKLYFQDIGGGYWVCSASSVTSAGDWGAGNRQMIVTAGHCCADGSGNWHGNWLFVPAYWEGNQPFGSWAGATAATFTSWFNDGDFSRDVCAIQLYTQDGVNVQDAVGALGYAWNWSLPQAYTLAGYPAADPFDGQRLWITTASTAETDTWQAGDAPFTHGLGSTMTGGSSGGPWVLGLNPGGGPGNWINGLNSYGYVGYDLEMFSPYFDDQIPVLFEAIATLPPAP